MDNVYGGLFSQEYGFDSGNAVNCQPPVLQLPRW